MTRCGRPKKGEEALRRDQLLDHAVRLFAECGYGNLSLETIAREARVSLRTIYRQFGSKAELFGAAVCRCSDRFVALLPTAETETQPLEDALIEFAREFLFHLTRPDLIRVRMQLLAEAQRFPELAAQFYTMGPERTLNRLAEFFAVHQRAGRVIDGDPLFIAGQFINCLRGERYQRLQLGLEPTPAETEIEPWARQAVKLFLGGCLRSRAHSPEVE